MNLIWEIETGSETDKIIFKAAFSAGNAPLLPLLNNDEKIFLANGLLCKFSPIFLLLEEGKAIERFDGSI